MPFLVSLHNLQKREFSKESKGKLFFLYFLHGFFFGVGELQANLPAAKPPSMALLVGKDEGDFVSF